MDRNEELSQDNTQKSSESKSQIECLKEGETVTGDGAAQENDPVAEENAKRRTELAAKLKYKLLNWDKIKAEEAEARAKVRDDEGEVIYNLHRRKIVRISEDLVVKKAPDIPGHEASNLRYIAANTTIPVPEVHDVRWENSKVVGLVMDYMPGKCLDDIWNTLSADQKQSIAEQLRGYICQLRGLKGDYIGAVDRGPVFTGTYTTIQGGPFDTEREFNDWLLEDLNTGIATGCTHYAKRALTEGHEIIFTHADLGISSWMMIAKSRLFWTGSSRAGILNVGNILRHIRVSKRARIGANISWIFCAPSMTESSFPCSMCPSCVAANSFTVSISRLVYSGMEQLGNLICKWQYMNFIW